VTGRVVDLASRQPIAGIAVHAELAGGQRREAQTSGPDGRFVISGLPHGRLTLDLGAPQGSRYMYRDVERVIDSGGTVDVGDLSLVTRQDTSGKPLGTIDVTFAGDSLQVATIDPNGAAAKSGLAVGDIVTTIDGVDVTVDPSAGRFLLFTSAGTPIRLGLLRGVTISVVSTAR